LKKKYRVKNFVSLKQQQNLNAHCSHDFIPNRYQNAVINIWYNADGLA